VTLDVNADGNGWFIDPTPATNEEFSWNKGGGEWIATPGGPADGRIDLLTVLNHEFGHVMGLDHSESSSTPVSVMVRL